MERKNYLTEKLSKEEISYIRRIIINKRNKFIRDNYVEINGLNSDIFELVNVGEDSVLEAVIEKCQNEIKSAVEFEKVISNPILFNVVRALSLDEKMMLFLLFSEKKQIQEIAKIKNKSRSAIWRETRKLFRKILKELVGGNEDV